MGRLVERLFDRKGSRSSEGVVPLEHTLPMWPGSRLAPYIKGEDGKVVDSVYLSQTGPVVVGVREQEELEVEKASWVKVSVMRDPSRKASGSEGSTVSSGSETTLYLLGPEEMVQSPTSESPNREFPILPAGVRRRKSSRNYRERNK